MLDIASKNNFPTPPYEVNAEEFNSIVSELENLITSTGQGLTGASVEQICRAVALYSSLGNYATDAGAANTYVLAAPSPLRAPPSLRVGLRVRFVAANLNTTASTLNYLGSGAIPLVRPDGSDTQLADVRTDRVNEATYFIISGSPAWQLTSYSSTASTIGVPTGTVITFAGLTAPEGYVVSDGTTIGSGSSGASGRANDDTVFLFTHLWNTYGDTICPVPGGRGVSAAADFSANKQITTINLQGRFARFIDNSGLVDPGRAPGSLQLDALQGFKVRRQLFRDSSSPGTNVQSGSSGTSDGFMDLLPIDDGTHGTPRIASETRPSNVPFLGCIKL